MNKQTNKNGGLLPLGMQNFLLIRVFVGRFGLGGGSSRPDFDFYNTGSYLPESDMGRKCLKLLGQFLQSTNLVNRVLSPVRAN